MPGTTTIVSRVKRAASEAVMIARSVSPLVVIALLFAAPSFAHQEPLPVDPSDWYGPHHAPRPHGATHPDSIVVDCTRHGDARAKGPLQAAIDRVRANGTIMIKPPG